MHEQRELTQQMLEIEVNIKQKIKLWWDVGENSNAQINNNNSWL